MTLSLVTNISTRWHCTGLADGQVTGVGLHWHWWHCTVVAVLKLSLLWLMVMNTVTGFTGLVTILLVWLVIEDTVAGSSNTVICAAATPQEHSVCSHSVWEETERWLQNAILIYMCDCSDHVMQGQFHRPSNLILLSAVSNEHNSHRVCACALECTHEHCKGQIVLEWPPTLKKQPSNDLSNSSMWLKKTMVNSIKKYFKIHSNQLTLPNDK